MKKMTTTEVVTLLHADGWYLDRQKGSHRQFKHPTKKGTVTVNGKPNEIQPQFILISIAKQAGWR